MRRLSGCHICKKPDRRKKCWRCGRMVCNDCVKGSERRVNGRQAYLCVGCPDDGWYIRMPHPAVVEREKRIRQEEVEELEAKRLRSRDRLAAKLGVQEADEGAYRLLEALVLVEEGEPVVIMAETMLEATELAERLLDWTTDLGIRDRLDPDVIFPRARSELLESAELSTRIFKFRKETDDE